MTGAGGEPPNGSRPGATVSRGNAARRWLTAARDVVDTIERTQLDAIDVAAQVFADAIADDALVHVFGSGHSRMNTEEMFPRIGSFPGFHPIAELAITNYHAVVGPNGLRQAMYLERDIGFARVVLQQFKMHPGDAFLIFSSTGINGMVVELATLVRQMGLPVVAVTSLAHTNATTSRHPSGRKLADVADIVRRDLPRTLDDFRLGELTTGAILGGQRAVRFAGTYTLRLAIEEVVRDYRCALLGYQLLVPGFIVTLTVASSSTKRYRCDAERQAIFDSVSFHAVPNRI